MMRRAQFIIDAAIGIDTIIILGYTEKPNFARHAEYAMLAHRLCSTVFSLISAPAFIDA